MILPILSILIILSIFLYKPINGVIVLTVWLPTLRLLSLWNRGVVVYIILILGAITLLKLLGGTLRQLDSFPMKFAFSLCILSNLITFFYWSDNRYFNLASCLTDYFLVLLMWIYYKPNRGSFGFFCKTLIVYLLILTIIGIYESVVIGSYNPFIEYLYNHKMISSMLGDNNYRFGFWRTQSLTIWSDPLCIVCGTGWVFLLYSYINRFVKGNVFVYALFVLLPITMFLTGSRGAMAGTIIMLLCCVSKFNKKNITRFAPIVVLLIVLLLNTEDYFNQLLNSYSGKYEGGSSVDMRQMQLNAALLYWNNSPIVGNGLGYSAIAQGITSDLMGVESLIFYTLINTGLIGLVALGVLFISSFVWVLKRKSWKLVFMLIGFYFAKIITLLYSIHETYILLFIIPLMKEFHSGENTILKDNK